MQIRTYASVPKFGFLVSYLISQECKVVLPDFTGDLALLKSDTEPRGEQFDVRMLCRTASCPVGAQMSKLE